MRNILVLKCERCGHDWATRKPGQPRICPKCKSPYWDRPRAGVAPLEKPPHMRHTMGPYLDVFARKQRMGWDTFGNEAFNFGTDLPPERFTEARA